MRREAERELSGFTGFIPVDAAAEDTGLARHSVDFITVAQAFHWFDAVRFREECRRILRPGGKVVNHIRAAAGPKGRFFDIAVSLGEDIR